MSIVIPREGVERLGPSRIIADLSYCFIIIPHVLGHCNNHDSTLINSHPRHVKAHIIVISVESGEGIERTNALCYHARCRRPWNPVKELKDFPDHYVHLFKPLHVESGEGIESGTVMRGHADLFLAWNPVKELKEDLSRTPHRLRLSLWNPVKELKGWNRAR